MIDYIDYLILNIIPFTFDLSFKKSQLKLTTSDLLYPVTGPSSTTFCIEVSEFIVSINCAFYHKHSVFLFSIIPIFVLN